MPKSVCLSRHQHPSHCEAKYCDGLLARKQSGEIRDYITQKALPIRIEKKIIYWKVDFEVILPSGEVVYHEAKGFNRSDDNFIYKARLFVLQNPSKKLFVNWEPFRVTPGLIVKCKGILRRRKKATEQSRLWWRTKNAIYHRTYDARAKSWVTVKTPC